MFKCEQKIVIQFLGLFAHLTLEMLPVGLLGRFARNMQGRIPVRLYKAQIHQWWKGRICEFLQADKVPLEYELQK